jgi:hypothetical protein
MPVWSDRHLSGVPLAALHRAWTLAVEEAEERGREEGWQALRVPRMLATI